MPNQTEVQSRVLRIISEQLGISAQTIGLNDAFIADLGCDSLDTVELVMAMEDEFGIEIPDAEAETVSRAVDALILICNKLGTSCDLQPPTKKQKSVEKPPKKLKRKDVIRKMQELAILRTRGDNLKPLTTLLLKSEFEEATVEADINKALDALFNF